MSHTDTHKRTCKQTLINACHLHPLTPHLRHCYSAMLNACANSKLQAHNFGADAKGALQALELMRQDGFRPSQFEYTIVMNACANSRSRDNGGGADVLLAWKMYDRMIQDNLQPSQASYRSAIESVGAVCACLFHLSV